MCNSAPRCILASYRQIAIQDPIPIVDSEYGAAVAVQLAVGTSIISGIRFVYFLFAGINNLCCGEVIEHKIEVPMNL
jgi:hypothetical protein